MGLIVVARLYGVLGVRRAIVGALIILGAGAVVIVWAPGVTVLLIGAAALGVGYGVTFATATGAIQSTVADSLRGRVMSIHTLVHLGMRPLFTPVAGFLGGVAGLAAAMGGFVLLIPVAIAIVLRDADATTTPATLDPDAALGASTPSEPG
jgi:MFS family permease